MNHITTPSSLLIKLAGFVGPHPAVVLVDCGATGNFVSASFAQERKLAVSTGDTAQTVRLADGRQQSAGSVVRQAAVRIDSYVDRVDLTVTALQGYDVVLGMPWLEQYRVLPDWRGKSVSFVGPQGQQHVLRRAPTGCQRWHPAAAVGATLVPSTSLNVISLRQVERLHRAGQLELACVVFTDASRRTEPSGVAPPPGPDRSKAGARGRASLVELVELVDTIGPGRRAASRPSGVERRAAARRRSGSCTRGAGGRARRAGGCSRTHAGGLPGRVPGGAARQVCLHLATSTIASNSCPGRRRRVVRRTASAAPSWRSSGSSWPS